MWKTWFPCKITLWFHSKRSFLSERRVLREHHFFVFISFFGIFMSFFCFSSCRFLILRKFWKIAKTDLFLASQEKQVKLWIHLFISVATRTGFGELFANVRDQLVRDQVAITEYSPSFFGKKLKYSLLLKLTYDAFGSWILQRTPKQFRTCCIFVWRMWSRLV